MLRTFGRLMPLLIPLSGVLAIALVIVSRGESDLVFWLRVAATFCLVVTVVTPLTVNVPINTRTAGSPMASDSAEWREMRERWHLFQGVRRGLFAGAFVLLSVSLVVSRR